MRKDYFYYKMDNTKVYDFHEPCENVNDIISCIEVEFENILDYARSVIEEKHFRDFLFNIAMLLKEYRLIKIGDNEFGLTSLTEKEFEDIEEF